MTLKNRRRMKWLIIAFWIFMIGISITAPEQLSNNFALTSNLTDPNTQSGRGQALYNERFNLTSETATQILIIELNNGSNSQSNIQSNQWRNFTFYLTLYLNQTYFSRNYTTIMSEPLALQAGYTDIANGMVSKDHLDGLIYMSGLQANLDSNKDVKDIRTEMKALIADPTPLYNFTTTNYLGNPNVTALFLPSANEIHKINIILTGSLANFVDIESVAKSAFSSSEVIAVIVVLIILAFVFRSPLGMIIPFISMVASLLPAFLVTWILSRFGLLQVNDFLPAVIAMIGIAVAIDYNLFSLTRYKEEFHKRKAQGLLDGKWSKEDIQLAEMDSSDVMNRTAGKAVMYSGISVFIGFISLLILRSDFANGLAIAVATAIVLSVITARTLTPAVLGLFGQYLDWPNITTRSKNAIKDTQNKKVINNIWTKWSKMVMKHSFTFLVIGILVIVPMAFISLQTNLSFDSIKSLPAGTESRDGFEILSAKFDLGSTEPYQILVDTGKTNGVFDSNIINATNNLAYWAMHYNDTLRGKSLHFTSVTSLSVYTNTTTGQLVTFTSSEIQGILSLPNTYQDKQLFVQGHLMPYVDITNDHQANNTLLISITSNLDQGSSEAWSLVVQIRNKLNELFKPLNVKTYVFGYAASFYDTNQSMYGNAPIMLAFAVILIFITLMVLFRSLLLPAKAILTISGSILFALGFLVVIFQDGNFLSLIAGEQTDGITFFIPLFLFTIVLGLGMDYTIFIISRIREEWEKGASPHDAVGIGLSKTAFVVTNAATVMIATFFVFALAPILFLKMVGVAMAIAIFVDATVSRMIILPSAMAIAGKWNWYLPKRLKKILPEVKLEH